MRSLAIGLVEVYGKAIQKIDSMNSEYYEKKSIAPFTNKKCVYYETIIQEYRSSGKSGKWITVHKEEFKKDFFIEDETGKVLINPISATLEISSDFEEKSNMGKDPSDKVKNYLESHNLNYEGILGMNKQMRYIEKSIAVNDYVYVIGDAMSLDVQSSVGSENIVIARKNKKSFFYISDKSEKEIIKSYRWKILLQIYGGGALIILSLGLGLASI